MELTLNLDYLKVVYIIGSVMALVLTILVYPSLKYGPKKDASKK